MEMEIEMEMEMEMIVLLSSNLYEHVIPPVFSTLKLNCGTG